MKNSYSVIKNTLALKETEIGKQLSDKRSRFFQIRLKNLIILKTSGQGNNFERNDVLNLPRETPECGSLAANSDKMFLDSYENLVLFNRSQTVSSYLIRPKQKCADQFYYDTNG